MNVGETKVVRAQLMHRQKRLQYVIKEFEHTQQLVHLLSEVDLALEKIDKNIFGMCETCHEPVEENHLALNPLMRNCISHLSDKEQHLLEMDLDLAYEIQNALLPQNNFHSDGWSAAFHYEPAGPVSGDYCDLIFPEDRRNFTYFLNVDVAGKGVAASILMAHLHAIFRSLIVGDTPAHKLVERANRIFCEKTIATHFATLVCGRAGKNGEVEICNAGHCFPLLVSSGKIGCVPSTGLPIGLFRDRGYTSTKLTMHPDDTLILYTDGITEAVNTSGMHYGDDQLSKVITDHRAAAHDQILSSCLEDLNSFRQNAPRVDDITMMVIRRDNNGR